MHSIYTWLVAVGYGGAPHWALLAITTLLLAPEALKRLKTPRGNTLVEIAADLTSLLIRRFPGLGGLSSALTKLLGSAVFLLVLSCASCAHGVTGGYQALANTANSIDTGMQAFESFDHDYEHLLVTRAKTRAEAEAALAAYQASRAKINKAFADAGAALSIGHSLLPLVESGLKKQADMDAWLGQLLAAGEEVQEALASLPALPSPSPNNPPSPVDGGAR